MTPVVVQLNLIVADLDRSHRFYQRLGVEFIPRNRMGAGPAEAWVSVGTGITVVLHSTGFAHWWDESAPQPVAGGAQMDLQVDSPERLDALVAAIAADGGVVIKPPADMPWGQRFAVVADPDGYRVGLKAERDSSGA
ncbi:VOC family protein [Gordonia sp. X0973]|uniref:VOC family protein n=1 Tax=Gordonia sp. X0973 TaxID=2742602 RepID=UPI000F534C21|nr:VOC family protein [Gordonia sp. X0973]